MSTADGIRPVVVTSFFPTAREVSVGLKWIKDHPIVATAAAAAATAVSVITYLRQEEKIQHVVSWSDEHGGSLTEILGAENDSVGSSCTASDVEENQKFQDEEYQQSSAMDGSSVSPQWGWYVSITPPQEDQYARHPNIIKNCLSQR